VKRLNEVIEGTQPKGTIRKAQTLKKKGNVVKNSW
jgi:hypothetical protein